MQIINVIQATELAKRLLGNPIQFAPISGKKMNNKWIIKANIGLLDKIIVAIEIPERLIGIENG